MRRFFRMLIPLALIAVGVLWPVVIRPSSEASDADDPVVFSNYNVDLIVSAGGRLDAVETITAEFPSGRHGLFKYWAVDNQNDPGVRQTPEVTSILLDGQRVPYQMLWEGGERFLVAKIGDPDEYLSYGTHVFEIRYNIDGVLDPGSTGADKKFADSTGEDTESPSVFFWNVIAQSWNNRIKRADISVTMPGEVGRAQCSVGFGVGGACDDLTVSGNRVEASATNLPPRTPVTLRAGVDVPTPPRAEVPWSFAWDRVLGQSVGGVLWVLALTVAGALGAILYYRTTVEPSPGFPLQYAPPPGLGPVQTEYIRTESVPKNGLTATLFYLADRGLIDMRQVNEKQWRIRGKGEQGAWADVDRASLAVGAALKVMRSGERVRGHEHRLSGEETQQGQDGYDRVRWRSGRSTRGLWSSTRRNCGCGSPTRSPSS